MGLVLKYQARACLNEVVITRVSEQKKNDDRKKYDYEHTDELLT